jgi:hypothetical protein
VKKSVYSLILLGFSVMALNASEIEARRAAEVGKKYDRMTTATGQVYERVIVSKVSDAGISITHADGLARLRYEQLTAEQREYFGITKEGAAAVYGEEAKQKAAYEAKVAEQQKATREFIEKHEVAMAKAELAEAQRTQRQPVVESTLEIPTLPNVRRTQSGVLYTTNGQPGNRGSTYYVPSGYYPGGYVYPGSYGYYPAPYHNHHPQHNDCRPVIRGPIINFTIK